VELGTDRHCVTTYMPGAVTNVATCDEDTTNTAQPAKWMSRTVCQEGCITGDGPRKPGNEKAKSVGRVRQGVNAYSRGLEV